MDPLNHPITWRRNAPEPESWTLTDETGAPFDFTGFSLLMEARLYPGAPGDPLVTLAMAAEGQPGFFFDDAANGQYTVTPPTSAQLEALPLPGDVTTGTVTGLAYDILLIHPDGFREPFQEGLLTLKSGVTI